jgi:hypothetical protein
MPSKSTGAPLSVTPSPVPTSTAMQTVSTVSPKAAPGQPKIDDTFAYVVLVLLIMLAALLITMVACMIYLRCQGKCPNCHKMQNQLEKWESGELKRITPSSVRKREAFNKSASHNNTSPELDLERGDAYETEHAHTAALADLGPNEKLSIWEKVKTKVLHYNLLSATVQIMCPGTEFMRSRTVAGKDKIDDCSDGSPRVASNPPQIICEPTTQFDEPHAPLYSRSVDVQRTEDHGSRVFVDVSVSEPMRYMTHVSDQHAPNHDGGRELEPTFSSHN